MKLLFRPDSVDNICPNIDAAEIVDGANVLGKTWADTLADELPPTEVPQEATVTAREKRQSSLLLAQAARHIEKVARHMACIDQVWLNHSSEFGTTLNFRLEVQASSPSMLACSFCEEIKLEEAGSNTGGLLVPTRDVAVQ